MAEAINPEVKLNCSDGQQCSELRGFVKKYFLKNTSPAGLKYGIDVPANSASVSQIIFALQKYEKAGDDDMDLLRREIQHYFDVNHCNTDNQTQDEQANAFKSAVNAVNEMVKAVYHLGAQIMGRGLEIWLTQPEPVRIFRASAKFYEEWRSKLAEIRSLK